MGAKAKSGDRSSDAHGYLTSAAAFAGITALWAVIVRTDPYYRLIDLFGARVPAAMIAYLIMMPLAGFLIGRWRYQAPHRGGAAAFAPKLVARLVHFTYVHLLIVLFTVAMATDYFLGLNIDQQVKAIDDRMFDLAARFAPWLAAYLAGFNLGRALRRGEPSPSRNGELARFGEAEMLTGRKSSPDGNRNNPRAEPTLSGDFFQPADESEVGDLDLRSESQPLTTSGLPSQAIDETPNEPGFLPPQDLDKLRPGLRELR